MANVSFWESAKNFARAFRNEFTSKGYYAEKFKGTQGIGDAMLRVGQVYKDSGKIAFDVAKDMSKTSLAYKLYKNQDKVKDAAVTSAKNPYLGFIPILLKTLAN